MARYCSAAPVPSSPITRTPPPLPKRRSRTAGSIPAMPGSSAPMGNCASSTAPAMSAASQTRRCLILHTELDADDGELTRTRKVRRRTIAERYASLVEALYSGAESVRIESEVTFEDGRKGTMRAELAIRDVMTAPVQREAPTREPAEPAEAVA